MKKSVFYNLLSTPVSRVDTVLYYCKNKSVLDIGCVNHSIGRTEFDNWLHGKIKDVARKLVGVDFLKEEVEELNKAGYEVICADVTKPLKVDEQFDVIMVGNLIEHLSDFAGFFKNLNKYLKEDGMVLISTANPFYMEQYFYSAFKNEVLINPEHTCWIDPVALEQLAARFEFKTEKVYWIKNGWPLSKVICSGQNRRYDMITGKWVVKKKSAFENIVTPLLVTLFKLFWRGGYKDKNKKYENDLPGMVYMKFISMLFNCFWRCYKPFIITSTINRYELYLSVLKKVRNGC